MYIETEFHNRIAILRMNRPKVNAIHLPLVEELTELLEEIQHRDNVCGVVITGLAGCFSAGLDVIDLYPRNREYILHFWTMFNDLLFRIYTYPKLIFSAITGHCPAGGTVLAMMTDYRVMSKGEYVIGLNEVAVGLIVPPNIARVYQSLVGKRHAEKLVMTGKLLTPSEAYDIGLVDKLCESEEILHLTMKLMSGWLEFPRTQQNVTKMQMRDPIIQMMKNERDETIKSIVDIWFSDSSKKIMKSLINNLSKK